MNETNQYTFLSRYWRSPVVWLVFASVGVSLAAGTLHLAGQMNRGTGLAILLVDVTGTAVLLGLSGVMFSRRNVLPATQYGEDCQSVKVRIIRGVMQTAGVVVFMQKGLLLVPFWGKEAYVPYVEIESVREETIWFGGQLLLRSTGFWLNLQQGGRIGLAVWNRSAEGLRSRLSENVARCSVPPQHSVGT